MNMGLKILLLYWVMLGCASTPKPVVKKKMGTGAAATKTVKGSVPAKPAAVKPATPPPPPAEEEVVEEEEDDQYSRMKRYYKK